MAQPQANTNEHEINNRSANAMSAAGRDLNFPPGKDNKAKQHAKQLNQDQSYKVIEESDLSVLKNPKLFLLILIFLFGSKDELYCFLVRISKRHGLHYL